MVEEFLREVYFLGRFRRRTVYFLSGRMFMVFLSLRGLEGLFLRGHITSNYTFLYYTFFVINGFCLENRSFVPGRCRMGEKFFQFCPARNNSLFRAGGSSRMWRGMERASSDRKASLSRPFVFRMHAGDFHSAWCRISDGQQPPQGSRAPLCGNPCPCCWHLMMDN